ncbi:hypothetical protein EON67_10560 [archaeon]|nr:MAG: hypothetical protein EON67_10560 [archaeon]
MATAAAGDAVPLAEGTLVEGMVEATLELPSNNHVNAMLTDMYQVRAASRHTLPRVCAAAGAH